MLIEVEVRVSKVGYLTKGNTVKTLELISNEKMNFKKAKELIHDEDLVKIVFVENTRQKFHVKHTDLIEIEETE